MTGQGIPETDVTFKLGTEAEQRGKTGEDGTLSMGQVQFGTEVLIRAKKDMFSDHNVLFTTDESTCGNLITIGLERKCKSTSSLRKR